MEETSNIYLALNELEKLDSVEFSKIDLSYLLNFETSIDNIIDNFLVKIEKLDTVEKNLEINYFTLGKYKNFNEETEKIIFDEIKKLCEVHGKVLDQVESKKNINLFKNDPNTNTFFQKNISSYLRYYTDKKDTLFKINKLGIDEFYSDLLDELSNEYPSIGKGDIVNIFNKKEVKSLHNLTSKYNLIKSLMKEI